MRKDLFYGYDYSKFMTGTDLERAKTISGAGKLYQTEKKQMKKMHFKRSFNASSVIIVHQWSMKL